MLPFLCNLAYEKEESLPCVSKTFVSCNHLMTMMCRRPKRRISRDDCSCTKIAHFCLIPRAQALGSPAVALKSHLCLMAHRQEPCSQWVPLCQEEPKGRK